MNLLLAIACSVLGFVPSSTAPQQGDGRSRDSRATRMSVVDFWKNETHGDGLNLRVAHGVNSWPALVEQLHEPFLNKSMLLEGDVFLQTHRRPRHRAIPVMSPLPARQADRMTFKEWLREVATLQKAIKINFRTTEVVHPVLEFLHAAQFDPLSPSLDYPLILHADVFQSPAGEETAVDPEVFVRHTESLFPDATLSLGWTRQSNYTDVDKRHKRLTWRQLFNILEYVARLDQPIMLSLRLSVAAHSKEQLLWLLGMDKTLSLLIWSDEHDEISDWQPIFDIRRSATKNRVLYDLLEKHRLILQEASADPLVTPTLFSPSSWRAVVFSSSSSDLSTVLLSERGPAFVGRPAALLLSHSAPPAFPATQTIEGTVHFLPKRLSRRTSIDHPSGVVIYLLDRIHDLQSPQVDDAVEVFIGYDGRVSIERRHSKRKRKRTRSLSSSFESGSIAQAEKSSCYSFFITDVGWRVTAKVTPIACTKATSEVESEAAVPTKWLWNLVDEKEEKDETPNTVQIQLDTPIAKSRQLRSVAIAKRGDDSVDFLLNRLQHSGAATTRGKTVVFACVWLFLLYL